MMTSRTTSTKIEKLKEFCVMNENKLVRVRTPARAITTLHLLLYPGTSSDTVIVIVVVVVIVAIVNKARMSAPFHN